MKKLRKRIFAAVLAALMMVTAMPATALYASAETETVPDNAIGQAGTEDTEETADGDFQGRAWRKLTIYDVVEIRKMLKAGMRGVDIASKMGISQWAVSSIKRGRTFSWLPENMEF